MSDKRTTDYLRRVGANVRRKISGQRRYVDDAQRTTLVEVGETSRGYKLYREPNEVGGHRYWSDAIGGGVLVWDTCLASCEELELAMKIEGEFERGER